ncbi:AvrD family protein [Streptomyces sp. cg2]|uniref:AvrD family protein n=1 Tax=Streptomyces sp. cg2 TaxID=3238799 RepID=UPI0034E26834
MKESTLPAHLRSVDDYLGPGEKRFFGRGYKRAFQDVRDLHFGVQCDGSGTVRGRASVRYPDDWSRKGSTNQAPHLSSIDALLVSGEVAELFFAHARHLDVASRSLMRLVNVQMKAGSKPVTDDLPDFPVEAAVTPPIRQGAGEGTVISAMTCQVAGLRVRLEVEHPVGNLEPRPVFYPSPDALLGAGERRMFAAAHKWKSQRIENLRIDSANLTATALIGVSSCAPPDLSVVGLESRSFRENSLIDVFVSAIQLGQILLYELDSMDRADSNTLWMRRSSISLELDEAVPGPSAPLSVRLEDLHLLTDRNDTLWRTARIAGKCRNITISCSATHQLPTK